MFLEIYGVAAMGKVKKSESLERELWRDSSKVRNKAMARSDRKLAKFAEKAEPGRSYTLQEIAKAMGVTRERVRQIEARALRKLYGRLGRVFKNENITPDDAMSTLARVNRGGLEHGVTCREEDTT